jgi:amidase
VLNYEFERDLDAYLARESLDTAVRSLAEVIAFNNAHADRTLKFGQTLALAAAAIDHAPDSADTARYAAARAQDLVDSRDSINALLEEAGLSALLFAGSGSARIGAKAGFPSVSVPAGYLAANRRPFSIAFLGPAWSEPALVGYAYAFEQATRLRRPSSQVNPAVFNRRSL